MRRTSTFLTSCSIQSGLATLFQSNVWPGSLCCSRLQNSAPLSDSCRKACRMSGGNCMIVRSAGFHHCGGSFSSGLCWFHVPREGGLGSWRIGPSEAERALGWASMICWPCSTEAPPSTSPSTFALDVRWRLACHEPSAPSLYFDVVLQSCATMSYSKTFRALFATLSCL